MDCIRLGNGVKLEGAKAVFLKGIEMADKKTCFIICALDKPETDTRKWADFVRKNVVEPVAVECGYEKPKRADDPEIGLLMLNIIERMFEADLVIADLTYYNPNVFFELGVRHCSQKPVIHLIRTGEEVPFDIEENKAIFLDRDYEKVVLAKTEIKQRIEAINLKPDQFHSQVQHYIQLKKLKLFEKAQLGKDDVIQSFIKLLERSVNLNEQTTATLKDLKNIIEKPKPRYSTSADILKSTLLEAYKQSKLDAVKRPATEDNLEQ